MISIIIASANKQLLNQVSANIRGTIGVPYEILAFENSDGKKGICEIYNKGSQKAQYELLCFMHEDILIETPDWGKKVAGIFEKTTDIGLLGVAGSTYKSLTPSSWFPPYASFGSDTWRLNIKQVSSDCLEKETHDYYNPYHEKISRVACLDGVWLCTRKKTILQYPFDEKRLKHFHGYDIDISMSINQHHSLYVTFEVLMKHFSKGNFNHIWLRETLKVHTKWCGNLPLNMEKKADSDLISRDMQALKDGVLIKFPTNLHLSSFLIFKFTTRLFLKEKINFRTYRQSLTRLFKSRKRKQADQLIREKSL